MHGSDRVSSGLIWPRCCVLSNIPFFGYVPTQKVELDVRRSSPTELLTCADGVNFELKNETTCSAVQLDRQAHSKDVQ